MISQTLNEKQNNDNQLRNHYKVKKANIPKFMDDLLITEIKYLSEVSTGDILLFNTNNFGAKIQRYFAKSKYDHIAMVLKLKGSVYILDS